MLSPADKRWIRKIVREVTREEFRAVIKQMIAEEQTQIGGYDGATEVVDDDWADEGKQHRRRIGFTPR